MTQRVMEIIARRRAEVVAEAQQGAIVGEQGAAEVRCQEEELLIHLARDGALLSCQPTDALALLELLLRCDPVVWIVDHAEHTVCFQRHEV